MHMGIINTIVKFSHHVIDTEAKAVKPDRRSNAIVTEEPKRAKEYSPRGDVKDATQKDIELDVAATNDYTGMAHLM